MAVGSGSIKRVQKAAAKIQGDAPVAEEAVAEVKQEAVAEVKSEFDQLKEEVAAATTPVKKQKVIEKIKNSSLSPVKKQKLLDLVK